MAGFTVNQEIPTKDPAAVAREVQATYLEMFPQADPSFVPRVFHWAGDCFHGRHPGYQAIDARYHDFEHTLQGTLCMARILRGRHAAGAQPVLPQRMAELGLLGILLHDTGYLKQTGDNDGTGAKYTVVHVGRSAEFAARLLAGKGFDAREIAAVQNMICCTGVDALLKTIPFQSEVEKITGLALATADLLGQMAADDYVEKLPMLYTEFAEAARFSPQKNSFVSTFSSARDLLHKTPDFWDKYVKGKLDRDLGGQQRYLNDPYPDGPNRYMDKIEANMKRLRKVNASETDTAMFLKKYHAA
jgi:hypothetical protein